LTTGLKGNILEVENIKNQKPELFSSRSLLSLANKLPHLIAGKVANNNISLAMGKGKREASNCFGETGVGAMPKGETITWRSHHIVRPFVQPFENSLL
jgi:hypothetical protein